MAMNQKRTNGDRVLTEDELDMYGDAALDGVEMGKTMDAVDDEYGKRPPVKARKNKRKNRKKMQSQVDAMYDVAMSKGLAESMNVNSNSKKVK